MPARRGARTGGGLRAADGGDPGPRAQVDLAWRQEDASPFAGLYGRHRLELRDSATGALLAWMEDGGSLSSLELPPELQVVEGDEECRIEQKCGTEVWTRATFTTADGEATLRPGGATDLGGLRVSFGGAMTLEDLSCSETSDGGAVAAALAL